MCSRGELQWTPPSTKPTMQQPWGLRKCPLHPYDICLYLPPNFPPFPLPGDRSAILLWLLHQNASFNAFLHSYLNFPIQRDIAFIVSLFVSTILQTYTAGGGGIPVKPAMGATCALIVQPQLESSVDCLWIYWLNKYLPTQEDSLCFHCFNWTNDLSSISCKTTWSVKYFTQSQQLMLFNKLLQVLWHLQMCNIQVQSFNFHRRG